MSNWRRMLRRLTSWSPTDTDDIDDELRAHVHLHTQDGVRGGLAPDEARRRAILSLGGVAHTADVYRMQRTWPLLDAGVHDATGAIRLLRKDYRFTATVLSVLAVGIALNSTMFTFIDAAFLSPLPFARPHEVVALGTRQTDRPFVAGPPGVRGLSYAEYTDWRDANRSFSDMAAYAEAPMVLGDDTLPADRVSGAFVSWNTFPLIGKQPALGRGFQADDDRPGATAVVLLGHDLWRSRYAGDIRIVGRSIRVNGVPSTVVGVMPHDFGFPQTARVWQPLAQMPGLDRQPRQTRTLAAIARLRAGVTLSQAQADATRIGDQLARAFPETNQHVTPVTLSFADRYVAPQMKFILAALMGAVLCVLLVACANVANLMLARGAARGQEMATRVALGATRGRLVRQLLVESLVLSTASGICGGLLSVAGIRVVRTAIAATDPPYWLRLEFSWTALTFVTGLCLGTALLCGLAPALLPVATRPRPALARNSPPGRGGSGGRWSSALIAVQIALTLSLLTGAALMLRSLWTLSRVDLGVETAPLTIMRLDLPQSGYWSSTRRLSLLDRLEERVQALPLRGVALASAVPGTNAPLRELVLDRQAPMQPAPGVSLVAIGAGYFETMGESLIRGRPFSRDDGRTGSEVVIINERLAALYLPGEDVIGRRLQLVHPTERTTTSGATIVGVAPDVRHRSVGTEPPDPIVFVPLRADPPAAIRVIARADPGQPDPVALLRGAVRAVDPDIPLFDIRRLDDWLAFLRWPQRIFGWLLTVFGLTALLLSAAGVYGVTSHAVTTRRFEVGVRMALGAEASGVVWLFLRRMVPPLALGLVLGLAGATGFQRVLHSALVVSAPNDGTTVLLVAVGLTAVGLSASVMPARRATQLSPVVTLREE